MSTSTLQTVAASSPQNDISERTAPRPLEEHSKNITCTNCRQSYQKVISKDESPTICCPFCPWPRWAEESSNSEETFVSEEHLDVFCPNGNFGCGWSGSLANVTYHICYECLCTPTITLTISGLVEETITMSVIVMMSDFEDKRTNNES